MKCKHFFHRSGPKRASQGSLSSLDTWFARSKRANPPGWPRLLVFHGRAEATGAHRSKSTNGWFRGRCGRFSQWPHLLQV